MFGFVIGTLSLIGLIKVWRLGRHGHGWRHGGARRWMLRRFFEELDTTPGQEKVVMEAVDDAQRKAAAVRQTMFNARSVFANAVRGEHFDSAAVNAEFEKQQAAIDEVKKSLLESMQKVHEAFTPEQRKRLGDLVEFGPSRMGGCHGRRFHGHGGYGRHGDPVSL